MRHKPRRATKDRREVRSMSRQSLEGNEACDHHSNATPEPMLIDVTSREHCTQTGGWQVVADLPTMVAGTGTVIEPTFMGLLSQPQE
jgi:hypothetical protein